MSPYVPGRRPWLRRAACKLSLALAVLLMGAQDSHAQNDTVWSDARTVGTTMYGGSAVAATGSDVYVAFGDGPVYVRRSTDSGATFSAPKLLSNDGGIHETDSLAAETGHVFAITFRRTSRRHDWCCDRELGNFFLHRSTDSGKTWLRGIPLTTSGAAFRVSIAVSLPYVHVAWSDFRNDRWAIYYRRSADGGRTWEPEQRLVEPGLEETNRPQIAALGKTVHLTWMDNRDGNGPCYTMPHCTETYYMRSLDAGASWSSIRRLTHNRSERPLLSGRSDIAAFGDGALFIAYDQDRLFAQSGVQYGLRSPDDGETWEAPFRLGQTPEEQTHPAVAALGSTGVAAWFDRRFGSNAEIYVRLSNDSGKSWSDEERASFSQGISSTPHVALAPGYLHIIWLEERDGAIDVLYRRRTVGQAKDPGTSKATSPAGASLQSPSSAE